MTFEAVCEQTAQPERRSVVKNGVKVIQSRLLKQIAAAVGLMGVGIVTTVIGIFADGKVDANDIRAVGILLTLVGVAWLITQRVSPPMNAAYHLGHAAGHAAGYEEGRGVAKPVVVPIIPVEIVISTGRHSASDLDDSFG